jgi:phosphatidate phosphatase
VWERKEQHLFRSYEYRDRNVHRLIIRLYVFIGESIYVDLLGTLNLGYFFVGVCFNQLMVDIAKYTIGRQRPHFIQVCQPSVGFPDCPADHKYITEFVCKGDVALTDKGWIFEI